MRYHALHILGEVFLVRRRPNGVENECFLTSVLAQLNGSDGDLRSAVSMEKMVGALTVSVEVYVAHGLVEIEMKGPQGEWFGFGF